MKGLLIKDFLLMKNYKQVMLFMLIIGIFVAMNDISFASGYILVFVSILSMSTITYDEANHGLNTLFTLPISKSDYVKEKYLFSLIITGIGFVFVTILGCFSKSGFMETLIILSTALLLLALSLPFQLKEGNEKGRIVLFVVVFGCTFLFAFLNQFIPKFFESIESVLNTMDPTMFSVGLLISSIILYFISMMISIRVYNKRILD
ncbi:ABC-2 transporter permease [uncultured Holdemanella sp.]|uniref:ABC-2 transporter permease n=1 Tax=uncultured Holdemanella sp. TaxID=1763549 RepID=UPI0028056A37|nr:ABC-2 transporter permease [uncultured Holdemanella sp.]